MTKPRPITTEEVDYLKSVLRYDPNTGIFTWKSKGRGRLLHKPAGCKTPEGYLKIRCKDVLYRAHRLAFLFMDQPVPDYVDHVNGIRDDNRWENLRVTSNLQNVSNQKKRPTNNSGFKGVSWHRKAGKWSAQIKVNYKKIHLGLYDCPKKAHIEYCKAADKYHKEFANYGT